MKLAFFTMPIHPLGKDWRQSLREDREAFLLADELGYVEGYVGEHSTDYVRPENQRAAALLREDFRNLTQEQFERQAENLPYGTADEVAERIIAQAEHAGANMVQIGLNRGAMPHDMFIEQIRRFATGVLPRLQAHEVTRVPAAESLAA